MRAVLPFGISIVFLETVRIVVGMPFYDWHAARLAPTFAWADGVGLYQPADSGPVLNTIYGPLSAVAYAPILISRDPTTVVLIGGALNLLWLLAPLYLVLRASGRPEERECCWPLLGLIFFFVTALSFPFLAGIWYSLNHIHADASAYGLGLLACACACKKEGARPRLWLGLAALLAALAPWAKASAAFVAPALLVYLFVSRERPAFWFFVKVLFGAGLLTAIAIPLAFGPERVWFNTFQLPLKHPFQYDVPFVLRDLYEKAIPSGGALMLLLVLRFWARGRSWPLLDRVWFRENPWTLYVLIALCMLPISIRSRLKLGCFDNNYTCLFYLHLALTMLLVQYAREDRFRRLFVGWLCAGLLFASVALGAFKLLPRAEGLPERIAAVRFNPQQQAYDFCRVHPGLVYFPWNPLSTYLAEGKLYHFQYGVWDRHLAGYPLSPEHYAAHLPANARYQAYALAEGRLSRAPNRPEDPELNALNGWLVEELTDERRKGIGFDDRLTKGE